MTFQRNRTLLRASEVCRTYGVQGRKLGFYLVRAKGHGFNSRWGTQKFIF